MDTILLTIAQGLAAEIIGYIACVAMVFGYLPQAVRTIRTRETDDIALTTFMLMGLGSFFFVIQGILINNWPIIITNVLTTTCSAIIFGIKINNDFFKKKKK